MNSYSPWDMPATLGEGFLISANRASDNTERYLRSLVYSGVLAPGEKLPPERELAKQLGIATVTLRAALRSLEDSGLILVRRGARGGSFVSDADSLGHLWKQWVEIHRDRLRQTLEFRTPIDILISRLAAERRTAAELEEVERAIQMHAENRPAAVRWHVAFHDALAVASHNDYLQWATLVVRSELFAPVDTVMQSSGFDEILGMHARLLAAVRDQDADRAEEEMRAHIAFTSAVHYPEAFLDSSNG